MHLRYIVDRIIGTLTYRVIDTVTNTTIGVVFNNREDANRVATNWNRNAQNKVR